MYSIGDDMFSPAMYQDIGMMSTGFYNPMMGMYPMQTNLLGGVRIHREPMTDKYETMAKKDKESRNTFKSVAKALFWMTLGGFIPPARKYIKKAGGMRNVITQLASSVTKWFKKSP